MTARIHPLAVVEEGARLGVGVVVGAFCHIGGSVEIGDNVELLSHVVIEGETRLGPRCRVFPFACLGAPSQDLKSRTHEGRLVIGADCIIRESVTVNLGSSEGDRQTRIGDGCALLANAHVAHDCLIGDGVVLSNAVLLGGHVQIGDYSMIGGASAVHQHVRIGAHAFVGGLAGVEGDVIPFALAGGNRAHLFGLNLVGLRRRNFTQQRIARLKAVYQTLFESGDMVFAERLAALVTESGEDADAAAIIDFLREAGKRPLCMPRRREPAR